MRRLLIAAALLCAAGSAHAELMLKSGDGSQELRLYDTACSHAGTLGLIPEEYRKHFKNSRVLDSKGTILIYACHAIIDDQVLVMLEDGQHIVLALSKFKESTI
jgi:hypothetical protein